MAGALMQLVAYGAQDVYLTGNPQITFFKVVYKRHTNFSMELIQQVLSGSSNFGNNVRCKINRAGDLLHDCWVNVTMPALAQSSTTTGATDGDTDSTAVFDSHLSYCNRVGFRLLKSVELRIGGQQIDRHTSLWMHLWSELSTPTDKKGNGGLNDLVGPNGTTQDNHTHAGEAAHDNAGAANVTGTVNQLGVQADGSSCASQSSRSGSDNKTGAVDGTKGLDLWVPLQFSFCRNPGLALPLIALQYHEVELVLELETFKNCLAHKRLNPRDLVLAGESSRGTAPAGNGLDTDPSLTALTVWGNYVFLDTEERKNFAQNPHEYLIETVQDMTTTCTAGRGNYRLNFNHPVKELVWFAQRNDLATPVTYTANLETASEAIKIDRAQGMAITAHDATIAYGASSLETNSPASLTLGLTEVTLLRGEINAYGGSTNALTGQYYGGDSFTDGTANARTVYLYATSQGVGKAIADNNQNNPAGTSQNKLGEGGAGTSHVLDVSDGNNHGPFCFSGTVPMCKSAVLKLNGQERFSERTATYFNRVQPYQHHSGTPDLGINSYSFALKPEEHQPSGTCNFSRIDNANLTVDCAAAGTLSVFAHSYNVLRVASGMGGLAYSN